jgi:hypothetical protein
MIFLRHHLHEKLKTEYLTVKDLLTLWNNLRERYEHQKTVILPKARYDWIHLRLQDFKSVSDYNSTFFKISSQLKGIIAPLVHVVCIIIFHSLWFKKFMGGPYSQQ